LWWFNFSLEPIYTTAPAASKNDACFKTGLNRLKIIILLLQSNSVTHSVHVISYVHHARDDLCNVRNGLDAESVEDEGDGFDYFRVVTREGRVTDDLHQGRDCNGRIKVVQGPGGSNVDQHLAGVHLVALLHLCRAVAYWNQWSRLNAGSVNLKLKD